MIFKLNILYIILLFSTIICKVKSNDFLSFLNIFKKVNNTEPKVKIINLDKTYYVTKMNKASENYGFFCNQIENINYFYPVDVLWRRQKCHALGLKLKRPLDYRANKKILGTPSKYKFIGGTGNCFYRALSYVVTGTEHNQFLLRTKISQVVRTNDKILHFLDGEEELTKYLKLININEEDTWSTSVDVLAAAILLNTSIYIYNSIKERWYFFSKDYPAAYSSVSTENERFIYLLNLSLTHFHIVEDIRFL